MQPEWKSTASKFKTALTSQVTHEIALFYDQRTNYASEYDPTKLQVKIIPVEEIITLSNQIYQDDLTSQNDESIKGQIKEVFDAIMDMSKLKTRMEDAFQQEIFKQWFVYEAMTGTYKFTGTTDLETTEKAVANMMLVFDKEGKTKLDKIDLEYTKKIAKKTKIFPAFKSHSSTSDMVIRASTEGKLEETPVEEEVTLNQYINTVIDEELELVSKEVLLQEGIIDLGKEIISKLSNSITKMIMRVTDMIRYYADKGFSELLKFLGIEIEDVQVEGMEIDF